MSTAPHNDNGTQVNPAAGDTARQHRPTDERTTERHHNSGAGSAHNDGASQAHLDTVDRDVHYENRHKGRPNSSWGAIFAGTAIFLALTICFGMAAAALGLGDWSGTTTGVWSIIFIVIALAAAGFVAGHLAVRSGLLHGLVTWATSILATVLLAGMVGSGLLGAIGGAATTLTEAAGQQINVTQEDLQNLQEEAAAQDTTEAQQQAEQTATEVADTAETGMWWAFAGTLIGGVIAALAGMLGARTALKRHEDEHQRVTTNA